jgi:hypothetical protein
MNYGSWLEIDIAETPGITPSKIEMRFRRPKDPTH